MKETGAASMGLGRVAAVEPAAGGSLASLLDNAFSLLRRRWPILLVGLLVGLAIGYFRMSTTPVTYVATASILVAPKSNELATDNASATQVSTGYVEDEVQAIKSPEVMERAVRAERLFADPEFNSALTGDGSSPEAPVLAPLGETTSNAAIEEAKSALAGSLSVSIVTGSSVLRVSIRASAPDTAARLANAVAEAYLAEQIDAKLGTTRQAKEWLTQQVATVGEQLQTQSAALQAERAASGLNVGGSGLAEQQVNSLSGQLSQARADLAARQARASSSDRLGLSGADATGEVMGSGVVQGLRTQEREIQRQIAQLSLRYGPQHPQMQLAQQQLADVQQQISTETARVSRGSQSELEVAQRRVAAIEAELARWTSVLARDTRRSATLQQLQSQVAATQATYERYVQRLQQITDLEQLQQPDARIIARAEAPGVADTPRPPRDFAQGLLIGLALAGGIILLLETMQRGLRTPQAVEDWTGLPCIVSVPRLNKSDLKSLKDKGGTGPADQAPLKPLSVYAEALRQLRTDLILAPTADEPPQVILFSSALPGEGKSTTALAFARTLALSGANTLLLEGDMRRPTIEQIANVTARANLIDVIENPDTLRNALIRDPLTELDIMPTTAATDRTGVDRALGKLPDLLNMLRNRYQYIVIDTAPILAVAETQIMASAADAVLLVVRWGKTDGDAIRIAVQELDAARIEVRGVVLNLVDFAAQSKYTRGDSAAYYSAYSKYYAQ